MKVTIKNLGPLESAEITLKPLTIFIGPNNSGKTWLAYTIAGAFGPYGFLQYLQTYLKEYNEGNLGEYPLLEKTIERALNSDSASIDLVRFAKESGEVYFNNVAQLAKSWLLQFLSSQVAHFDELDISVSLENSTHELAERILNYSLRSEVSGGRQKPLLSVRKKRGDKRMYVYTSVEYASSEGMEDIPDDQINKFVTRLPPEVVKEIIVRNVFQALHRLVYPQVRIFPTERTTFIAFPHGTRRVEDGILTIEENTSEEKNLKSMIGPVNYFLSMMRDIFDDELHEKGFREYQINNNPKIKKYDELATLLESQILGGGVNISLPDTVTQEISQADRSSFREVIFQLDKTRKLEISIASSMVKELAPLVLYLRYLAQPNELVVIDEPEMNLHPEAQVKLIEFLAMLVNAGLNILITTHSPYLVDHLTNLVKANNVENKEQIQGEFYLKNPDAFISKDKVAVYYINNGHAEETTDEEGTGEWNTFGKVSDTISDIYFKL